MMGHRWIRASIDYHRCITSKLTNQVCQSPISLNNCMQIIQKGKKYLGVLGLLYVIFEQLCTTREQNQEKYKPRKLFCGMQSKNFHAKVQKVSPENTATWKIKSSTSSLDLCAQAKLAQITVLKASRMKQKSSMTDGVHQNGATGKNVKRYQPVKNAVLRWNLIVQEIIFQKSFSQKFLRNHFLVSMFLK